MFLIRRTKAQLVFARDVEECLVECINLLRYNANQPASSGEIDPRISSLTRKMNVMAQLISLHLAPQKTIPIQAGQRFEPYPIISSAPSAGL
ncbi:unnamed protein product [Protopolystoma xenopodis]|uniref:Uncharacterized protein n=1 Tax=Protopolystoma xenopodis TaxID=117903 RepID=A0A3S5FBQ2_9PLAT|nr:unnamed protein product [Protopolystoma xenopodis]